MIQDVDTPSLLNICLGPWGFKPWGLAAKSFPKEQENVTTKL